jgi:putative PIG3 family NAD(P)H quinone oxidoreductase
MTEMMHAILPRPGEPLTLGEIERPPCGPNDVLIAVKAAGMNRADLIQQAGRYPAPPGASKILGLEVAGIVEAVGASVTRWSKGDEVCALLAGGGYAQFAAVDQGSVLPVPTGMDMVNACCLPEAMFTVWANVFDRAALKPGEDFLCHGGTSGIGVMAIQMARLSGAKTIYATAGSADKCALAKSLGADTAINYREKDFEEIAKAAGGVDVILDMVGGDYVQKNIGAAKLNGRIVNIAYQDGFETTVNFAMVLMKRLTLTATTLRARSVGEKQAIRDVIERDFWGGVNAGDIKPVLDSTFALADAGAAHEKMAAGGHSGKIILTV